MQLFVSDKRFVNVHDVKWKKEFEDALKLFNKYALAPKSF